MGIFSKNKAAAAQPEAPAKKSQGRPLFFYLLPTGVVGILLLLLSVVMAQQSVRGASEEAARGAALGVASALSAQLEGEIAARRNLLALAMQDAGAVKALRERDEAARHAVESALQARLPGLIQARLLPAQTSQPDPSGPAPLGYAGLEMLQRAAASASPVAAEVHQIKSGTPYLAIAQPVATDDHTLGVMFSAWDLRPLVRVVEGSPAFPGFVELVQGSDAGYVLAMGPGATLDAHTDGWVEVQQTIWRVNYGLLPEPAGFGHFANLLMMAAGGTLALLLATFLQWRMLSADLREDMGTLVTLGEAILRREGLVKREVNLTSSADAAALLGQYARDARGGAAPAAARPSAPMRAAVAGTAPPPPRNPSGGVEVEELDSEPTDLLGKSARPAVTVEVPESLFRAYDVRGVVGETLTAEIAQLLGKAVGSLVQERGGQRVVVAADARVSSPELSAALIRGLVATGCGVVDLGQAPTPLLYFAMHTQGVQGGVVVTGSHNPSNYNGFKVVVGDAMLDGDALKALRVRMQEGEFRVGQGSVEQVDLVPAYIEAVTREVQLARPLKVVVDAGNGVAGDLAIATFEALGCEVVPLFCEPDGTFPNHHPDPSQPDNLASLILEIQAQEADIGFAFDADGDRLGVIDNEGGTIWPDAVLMLLAADVLGRHPGVDILYDVKSTRHLASFVLSHGGRPIMWKSGHSRMRAKMLETGALLGGEFSGHLFIKERWYGFDDAVYAATRVLELLALEARTAAEVFAEIPSSPSTPEYHLPLEEGQSPNLMRALDAHKVFDDARLVELDGLRVEFANGWGLIRPSNTTPSLTFRFEADDEGALEQIKARFRDLLRRVAPDMQAPF